MTYQLARPARLGLEDFARLGDVHPELLQRFVVLGLVDATTDSRGALWFRPGQLARLARIRRLRAGLSLNYASLGLVLDLLDRIAVLEAERRRFAGRGARTWR
jgi:MerR-like DNA binding protein